MARDTGASKLLFDGGIDSVEGGKNILRAVDSSLRRLHTDYIDLYIMHVWDRVTPVEEVAKQIRKLRNLKIKK